jgi:hypothetical protein
MPDDALNDCAHCKYASHDAQAIQMFPIDMNAIKAVAKLASEIIRRIPTGCI